jgi:hypothetical protein
MRAVGYALGQALIQAGKAMASALLQRQRHGGWQLKYAMQLKSWTGFTSTR